MKKSAYVTRERLLVIFDLIKITFKNNGAKRFLVAFTFCFFIR